MAGHSLPTADSRPSLIDTLVETATAWEKRSTCLRGKAGCVIVTDQGGVLSQGYNGAPHGLAHCTDVGCLPDPAGICPDCDKGVIWHLVGIGITAERQGWKCRTCDGKGVLTRCVRSVHAEMNAIIWAARMGIKLEGATLVSTVRPCLRCTTALIQAGVTKVIYVRDYPSDDYANAVGLLESAGVTVERYPS